MCNFSNFKIPMRALVCLLLWGIALSGSGCRENELDDGSIRGFDLSTGWDIVLGELRQDTTINVIVTSDAPWSAENSGNWSELNICEGGERTSLQLLVKRNYGLDSRDAVISFSTKSGKDPHELRISQTGAAPTLRIEKSKKIEMDYQPQDTIITVSSNLELAHAFSQGDTYYDVSLDKADDYTYHFRFTCPVNNDTHVRGAKYVLRSSREGYEKYRDTIYLSQMYFVEPLCAAVDNGDAGIVVSWNKAANSAVRYYELQILNPATEQLTVVDVSAAAASDTPSYDISGLDLFANAQTGTDPYYMGNVSVRVVAKVTRSDEALLAMSNTVQTHSHFDGGEGTSSSPYRIAVARHLNNIGRLWERHGGDLRTRSFSQTADIVLADPWGVSLPGDTGRNMEIISTNNNTFDGSYDGGNFRISNLYISSANVLVAPFAQIGKSGTVKNLRVEVRRIQGDASSTTNVGGIAALSQGLIENCHVSGIDANSVIYCPNNAGRGNTATVYNGFCGGIAGAVDNGTDAGGNSTITHCSNSCLIVGLTTTGGIVGGTHNAMNAGKITVSYCFNSGDVCGGFPGADMTLAGNITIASDISNQTVIGSAGGIFGRVDYNGALGNYTIDRCFNSGTVTSDNILGGIGGKIQRAVVDNCYNVGKISQTRNAANSNVATGGLCGHINPAITGVFIRNSYNAGTVVSVAGADYCGLICGNKGANTEIANVVGLSDATGTPKAVMGVKTRTDNVTGKILTAPAEMQSLSNFYDTFGTHTWVVNPSLSPAAYPYPQLVGLPHVNRTAY